MTLDELRSRATTGDESLWWTYRFLQRVMERNMGRIVPDEDDLRFAADCFVRVAQADHEWASQAVSGRGPNGHGLAKLLTDIGLDSVLARIDAPILRARILCGSAAWQDLRADGDETWKQAWSELIKVPDAERDDAWKELALGAAAVAEYTHYRALAMERLTTLTDPFWRSHFLQEAVAVAARHGDWLAFATWVRAWDALPEPMRQGHGECEVLNLKGLRALDEGRDDDAETLMKLLVEAATGVQFLANENTSAFPKRMRLEKRSLDLCDAFDELVKRTDWRLVTK